MKKTIWLNVTGSPRSGTTALGSALNKSDQIALLHEHYPKDFFEAINLLFKNEEFHSSFESRSMYADSIISRGRDEKSIVNSIFFITLRKSTNVIGTKFPGLQRWEKTIYPDYLDVREIHITRNPIDVVNSYTTKGDGTISDAPDVAFCDWLNSFNHAVLNYEREDFLWLLYESFRTDENDAIAKIVADHLKIPLDFSLGEIGARGDIGSPKFLDHPAGQETLDAITTLFDLSNWAGDASKKITSGKLIGYPLDSSESINLSIGGNSWKYAQHGFYPPEQDGSWTNGPESILCFTPESIFAGQLSVLLEVSWILETHDEPTCFEVYFDDQLIGKSSVLVGKSNGQSNHFIFNVGNFVQSSRSITLRIVVENPRNPCSLGVSNDNRNIGLMIRNISFAP